MLLSKFISYKNLRFYMLILKFCSAEITYKYYCNNNIKFINQFNYFKF